MIPSSITSIPAWAFDSCRSLTNITIPNSVASIESWAFQYCYSLASVTIGSGVTNVANEAFYDCTNLAALTVDPLNSVYSSVDSVLFNKSQTTLIQYPAGKAGSYAIPNTVTGIGDQAFWSRTRLASVTIPDTVTSIGEQAFYFCVSLTNVTMGNSVTSIGSGAFCFCTNLTRLTIPTNVSSIGSYAFEDCYSLNGIYFMGNAPGLGGAYVFSGDNNATVYYLPGTTGWGPTFGGLPTALWVEVPTIQTAPQTQTAEEGSAVGFWAQATSALPLSYAWYFDNTNFLSCNAGGYLELTNVQLSQAGAYTVIISNALGAVTSAPFMLNVIPSVERRPVPGVKVVGEIGNSLNLEQTESLGKTAHWLPLDSVTLTNPPQYWFDVTKPLPSQRYYRAREVSDPPVLPTLDLHMVPAITLTGNIGDELRLDCINAIGPTDAWVTLDTITLTNTSQLYFDTNAVDQPTRLYRIVPEP